MSWLVQFSGSQSVGLQEYWHKGDYREDILEVTSQTCRAAFEAQIISSEDSRANQIILPDLP